MQSLMCKKSVEVKHIDKDKFKWKCKYCLNIVSDEYCKVGYSVTCNKCKSEYEIKVII